MAETSGGDARHAATVDAASRGSLEIRTRAVETVAVQASREVAGTTDRSGVLRSLAGRTTPSAEAHLDGTRGRVKLDVAVAWPAPVAELAARVREQVLERTTTLTGLELRAVDVTVHVVPLDDSRRRSLR